MKIIMLPIILILLSLFSCNDFTSKQDPELQKSIQRGSIVYEDFCMQCHLLEGKGVPNAFPPLNQSDYLMHKRKESIKAIKFGISGEITVNGQKYNSVMTPLGLSDKEVADVMNYVTNSWDNKNNKMVTEAEVSKIEP
ncbi:MAG: cytochrome c [Aquaticitalea sp.]